MLYVGRVDRNKGALTLFAYFKKFLEETNAEVDLVLAGKSVVAGSRAPAHPPRRLHQRAGEGGRAAAVPAAGDAVALREPVGDRARGVEARRAGDRQRSLQSARRTVFALERRALLPRLRRVRRGVAPAAAGGRARRLARRARARPTSTASTPGRRSTPSWTAFWPERHLRPLDRKSPDAERLSRRTEASWHASLRWERFSRNEDCRRGRAEFQGRRLRPAPPGTYYPCPTWS